MVSRVKRKLCFEGRVALAMDFEGEKVCDLERSFRVHEMQQA